MSIFDLPDINVGDVIVFLDKEYDIEYDHDFGFDVDDECYCDDPDDCDCCEDDEDCDDLLADSFSARWRDSIDVTSGYWVAEVIAIDGDRAEIEVIGYVKDKNETDIKRILYEDFWWEPTDVSLYDVRLLTSKTVNNPSMYERQLL